MMLPGPKKKGRLALLALAHPDECDSAWCLVPL